jgi:hypothetical protein
VITQLRLRQMRTVFTIVRSYIVRTYRCEIPAPETCIDTIVQWRTYRACGHM